MFSVLDGHEHIHKHKRLAENVALDTISTLIRSKRAESDKDTLIKQTSDLKVEKHSEHKHENAHSAIGVTLVLGFVFMLIIDQIGGKMSHRSHSNLI